MSDTDKFDKILSQVRALLAKADSTEHQGEEDLLRAKAESLMLKYRIEEALVYEKAIGEAVGLEPVWMNFSLNDIDSEFGTYYRQIAGCMLAHVGAKGLIDYDYNTRTVLLKAVGFQSDLRFGELLLTSMILEFGKRLEPRWDPNKSDQENCWALREAGWTRKRIAAEMFPGGYRSENEMKSQNRKVTNLIKKHGAEIGENAAELLGRGNNMNTFRESYAAGFVNTINTRLWNMRHEAMQMTGGGIVPVSRTEAVEEAFYTAYPQYRPKPVDPNAPTRAVRIPKVRQQAINHNAYSRGRTAAYGVDLGPTGGGRRLDG